MEKQSSTKGLTAYYAVKIFAVFICRLPVRWALAVGRMIGRIVYCLDFKHRVQIYSNLKVAYSQTKSPSEIRKISKDAFKNYGMNLMELLRLPLTRADFDKFIKIEGKEHVESCLKQGKGVILLAMHYGSWELANLACAMLGAPYKVIVKPQKKFSKLDELLNSYRACGGSVVLERGFGTREFIKSIRNNEIVGLVVDQGGKDGALVPFFGREASLSVGAIRMGLKMDVPVCFAIILRENGYQHRMVIHQPFELINTGDIEADVKANLLNVTHLMEGYINKSPADYMWFYKIWKYSKEVSTVILNDGRTGHLRQSQATCQLLAKALSERGISAQTNTVVVQFKNDFLKFILSLTSTVIGKNFFQGRMGFLKFFLTRKSYQEVIAIQADFVVSCGSKLAAINYLLSKDQQAKSVSILKPGFLNSSKFDLIVMPKHDLKKGKDCPRNAVLTAAAPNLISPEYLQEQGEALLKRFSHLKLRNSFKIGLLIGGDTKDYKLSEQLVKVVVHQVVEAAGDLKADILVTTSRRTPDAVENLIFRELKKNSSCPLFISARRNNIPEAVGGMLDLSDVVVVSGDSISMVSEAASSGKKTVVFTVADLAGRKGQAHKHSAFVDNLGRDGYVLVSDPYHVKQTIYGLAKNKFQTRELNDNAEILEGLKRII